MITTHQATPSDAQAMCDLINPIITEGSTTAHRSLFEVPRMLETHINAPRLISTTLAVDGTDLLGFQLLEWVDPTYDGPEALPDGWTVIASFVRPGQQGRGIGQILWAETKQRARDAGVGTIDASIRCDNIPGLAYYSGLGFRDYATIKGFVMSDGVLVDKIRKRYDLSPSATL